MQLATDGDRIKLTGDMLFPNAVDLRSELEASIKRSSGLCIIDFKDVKRVDSSALSVCLCCIRFAVAQKITIKLSGLPEELLGIARLVGLDLSPYS